MAEYNDAAVMVSLHLLQTNTGQLEGVPANPRLIKNKEFEDLKRSILVFPQMLQLRPIVYAGDYVALGGNQRRGALLDIAKLTYKQIVAKLEKWQEFTDKTPEDQAIILEYWEAWTADPDKLCPAYDASHLTTEQMAEFVIKDNVQFGENDYDILANEWDIEKVKNWGIQLPDEWDKVADEVQAPHAKLTDTFIVPPFTILDTRQGYWRTRKEEWRAHITDNGESREKTLSKGHDNIVTGINNGVSLLDPVLAELAVKWFAPSKEGNACFDPFAGDTVFGFVSAYLKNTFTGIELRKEQAELNNARVEGMSAEYINDDGQNVTQHVVKGSQDLLFSCPPYFDLEVYSDLPNDASNQGTYKDFLAILENAFVGAIDCLKENRFAVIVCGDVRDNKQGGYYGFPDDLKAIFNRNGMITYNELILVEALGTLPQRVGRFMQNRKIGKCHQNVLVFYNGDTSQIKKEFTNLTQDADYGGENEQS